MMEEQYLYAETNFNFQLSSSKQSHSVILKAWWAISMHNEVYFIHAHREQINFKYWHCSGVV